MYYSLSTLLVLAAYFSSPGDKWTVPFKAGLLKPCCHIGSWYVTYHGTCPQQPAQGNASSQNTHVACPSAWIEVTEAVNLLASAAQPKGTVKKQKCHLTHHTADQSGDTNNTFDDAQSADTHQASNQPMRNQQTQGDSDHRLTQLCRHRHMPWPQHSIKMCTCKEQAMAAAIAHVVACVTTADLTVTLMTGTS